MKRHVLTLGIFLLLGAVVNVAVAWALVLSVPIDSMSSLSGPELPGRLPPEVEVTDEYTVFYGFELRSRGCTVVTITTNVVNERGREAALPLFTRVVSGWPLASLDGTSTTRAGRRVHAASLLFLPDVAVDYVRWSILPLRPRWPAFGVNTLAYASSLWLAACGPFVAWRFVRIKRGRCPRCGYPCGASPICAECGHQLRR